MVEVAGIRTIDLNSNSPDTGIWETWGVRLMPYLSAHLSLKGIEADLQEICRVTRQSNCAGFFNMDEMREHVMQQAKEYH